jgi:hypothetical protein
VNFFEAIADKQQNAASKARDRAAEKRMAKLVVKSEADAPMVAKQADKEVFEQAQQMKRYRAAIRQRREDLLNGPHGQEIQKLLGVLEELSLSPPMALVDMVERSPLRQADYTTRHDVLSIISSAIIRFRIREGLAPFDDAIFDEPATAFEQIRWLLTGVGRFREEAA